MSAYADTHFGGVEWDDPEVELLREAYPRGGLKAARKSLPHRSSASIYRKANKLGLLLRRRWTPEEEERLRSQWGLESLNSIARMLGRKPRSVYDRAYEMGLELRTPEGWETLNRAADRGGYASRTMRKILAWAGVRIIYAYSARRGRLYRQHIVECSDVDDAIERWLLMERITPASRRLGVADSTLRRACELAGVKLTRISSAPRGALFAESSEFDRAMAERARRNEEAA